MGVGNGWSHLRIGELKSMLALAGGDFAQALLWVEWTLEFNSSLFTAERANYYRCLQTLLQLTQQADRQPDQYYEAFTKMYGQQAVTAASRAIAGENCFMAYGQLILSYKRYRLIKHYSTFIINCKPLNRLT